jgi:hypothetical protein
VYRPGTLKAVALRLKEWFMTPEDQEIRPAQKPGLSRRGVLRGAGGIGLAGVAAGLLVDGTASAASAATTRDSAGHQVTAAASSPLVAHVHDARTGEVDLFTGEDHVRVHNPALARALADAATGGR